MDAKMELANFKPSNPIYVVAFFQKFKRACNRNIIHRCSRVFLPMKLVKDSAKAAIVRRGCALSEDDPPKKERLVTNLQVVKYLVGTFATGEAIYETEEI